MKRTFLSTLLLLLFLGGNTYALPIQPGSEIDSGLQTSEDVIREYIEETYGVTQIYKQDLEPFQEAGPLAGSYQTTFLNEPDDPEEALIEYVGGDIAGDPAYLLVKDGSQNPAWYFFNLTTLGWNGTDDLVLSGFWPNQGAISHVSLYGGTQQVPEPSTMLFLGFGLLGTAVVSRRKLIK